MKSLCTSLLLGALWSSTTWGGPTQAANPHLDLPEFSALAQKASQSVNITLDSSMLGMASRFFDSDDPQDAATLEVIKGLRGIYVRSYTFDQDNVYRQSDIDAVIRQLAAPGWTRLVQTKSSKTHANVDIYIMVTDTKAIGMALIASEAREFTIVNIVGSIDLNKLHKLEGHFGVPNLNIDTPAK
jgi:Domain of unknown function (DUF4252)